MKKKQKIDPNNCGMCGAPHSLQSGIFRCTNSSCGHVASQTTFAPCEEREPRSRYPVYQRETMKPVDEEFK